MHHFVYMSMQAKEGMVTLTTLDCISSCCPCCLQGALQLDKGAACGVNNNNTKITIAD